jgi:putative acetyltransferase
LASLYRRSVEEIGARDYTPRQVEAWAASAPTSERIHERATDGRTTLVAVDGDRPLGFIDLEHDGHIDFFYCAPEAAGQGVAASLYDALEALARQRGVTRLYAEASEAARRFLLKRGFTVTARRVFALHGVRIHNYAVEKALTPCARP